MNAFQVLGLKSNATATEIKAAYRKLAQINHPDKCGAPGATAALSAINVAYQYLTKGGRRVPEFPDTLVILRSMEEYEKAAEAAAQAAEPKKAHRTTRVGKMGLKALLRNDLIAAGIYGIRMSSYIAAGYTESNFKTAISDLRSVKYCGKDQHPLNILHDGEWYFIG